MLFLDSSEMKASAQKDECLMETKMPILNGFKNIVENGAFAHYEQMLHFPQCFQRSCTTEASIFVSMR